MSFSGLRTTIWYKLLPRYKKTRMHSSRMHTAHSLTVSRRIPRTPRLPPCMPPTTMHAPRNHICPPATMHTPHNHVCPPATMHIPPATMHAPPLTIDFVRCTELLFHARKTLISTAILTKNQPFTCPLTPFQTTLHRIDRLMFLDILFELSKHKTHFWDWGGLTSLCLILSKQVSMQ